VALSSQRVSDHRDIPEISVVVPLFNEQENIDELYRRLTATLTSLDMSYQLVLVDDGSRDATPGILDDLQADDDRIVVVHLSRNFGHQAAISAGIDHACGRAVAVMDGDLQDPPECLSQLVQAWREGYDVVYAVRTKRKESVLWRLGYALFYRLLRGISDIDIPLDSGDCCLMDRRAVNVLKHLPERQRFVRGLRSFVGFRQLGLPCERAARFAGKPKFTLGGLLRLALDGLVGFSGLPLNLVSYLGLASFAVAILASIWLAADCLIRQMTPVGWAIAILVVLYLSTIQLFSLGIMSEYIRRIFFEAKGRPTYIVRDIRRDNSNWVLRLPRRRRKSRKPVPAA
jgi:dolichol-phosphate mannosyltransferase